MTMATVDLTVQYNCHDVDLLLVLVLVELHDIVLYFEHFGQCWSVLSDERCMCEAQSHSCWTISWPSLYCLRVTYSYSTNGRRNARPEVLECFALVSS